jgi:hypothetical protein
MGLAENQYGTTQQHNFLNFLVWFPVFFSWLVDLIGFIWLFGARHMLATDDSRCQMSKVDS